MIRSLFIKPFGRPVNSDVPIRLYDRENSGYWWVMKVNSVSAEYKKFQFRNINATFIFHEIVIMGLDPYTLMSNIIQAKGRKSVSQPL